MLEAIRRHGRGLFAWLMVTAIIIPFAFWGIQNYFQIGKEQPVAVVGDVEIYERDVQQFYEETLARFLPFSDEKSLKKLALEQLILKQVLLQEAKQQGLEVTEEEIALLIKQTPDFQTDGRFDLEKFQTFLRSRGITEEYLIHRLRQSLLIEKLQAGIRDSAPVTDEEARRFYELQNQKRQVAYLILPESLAGQVKVSEEEIERYYKAHPSEFTVPERLQVEYIELAPEILAEQISISEEKLKEAYQTQLDRLTESEKRRVRHILIAVSKDADEGARKKARQKAEELLERLKAGEDFATLAKRFSDDPLSREKGGDLGWVGEGDVTEALFKAIVTQELGEVKLVKSPFGFHLVEVTEIRERRVKPFEAVREILAKELRREEAEKKFYEMAEEMANLAYENPGTLEPIAKTFGLEIKTSPFFSREKGKGIAADPKVREVVFSETVLAGENSEPIELEGNRLVVLRLRERQPSRQKPLDEVREEIRKHLLEEKRQKRLAEKAKALLASGKPLLKLAEELGLEWRTVELHRQSPFEGDPMATAKLFRAKEKKPFLIALLDGRQLLAEVTASETPSFNELEAQEKEQFKAALRRLYGQVELQKFSEQLKEEAEIEYLKPLGEDEG